MPNQNTILKRYINLKRGLKITIFLSLVALGIAYLSYGNQELMFSQAAEKDYDSYKIFVEEKAQMVNMMIFFGAVLFVSVIGLDFVTKRTPSRLG
ncbi:MAG: hypothetical protein KDE26_23370 [Bacteroidetes bacterium]|nr:hypothetical protein [Bacteroidota bacterium]